MTTAVKSIDVESPGSTAYNQWTQFEDFPQFMEGVEQVTQLNDQRLHWVANVGGQRKERYARITEQIPDERIAWTSEAGTFTSGVVTFHRLDEIRTRVAVQMEYDPESIVEEVGDKLGFVSRRVEGDLKRLQRVR